MSKLGSILSLEYGEALPATARSDSGYPVFGSNGEVGSHHAFLVPGPGIVVGRKGSVGKVAWSGEPFWPIDTTYWVKCSEEDRRWIYWLLSWLPLHRLDSSTGVPGLNRNDVYQLSVHQPKPSEKAAIARVLDALNTIIHETETIIKKLKAIKQGMLHDLLTRGIDANGELRPPQSEAPHLYKESPLGWIPKEWRVATLARVCSSIVDCPHSTPHFEDTGVLVARTMHIKDGIFLEKEASRVSEHEYQHRIARLEPQPGDLVFTREAPVGEAFVIPSNMRICLGQRVMLLRPQEGVIDPHFLLAQIYSRSVKDRIGMLTSGTTNPHLNVSEVKELFVPLPNLDEQKDIVAQLDSLNCRLESETDRLDKQRAVKLGLMDDLLSGRIRVTPLLSAPEAGA